MAWTIEYAGSVRKSVRRLDQQVQHRIRDFLELRLAGIEDPRQLGSPLHGRQHHNLWRYRVEDYRIIAEINDRDIRILIVRIAHRRYVYES
ncbi:MAG: type II toxin-antitoxin system RelE/ParE family toxin [Albidovulum sp.]|nr:type II toxin-antitoxin system RelE/ParE family toxin [Albidovulum sp.]